MRELMMGDFHRFIHIIDNILNNFNVYDTYVIADKQWQPAYTELLSLSKHFELFTTYNDSLIKKKEIELIYSISENLLWRFTFLNKWANELSVFLDKDIETPFNPWILAQSKNIIDLQNSLVKTNFKAWFRGNDGTNIFSACSNLYSSTTELYNTLINDGFEKLENVEEWDRALTTFLCGVHKFNDKEQYESNILGELAEKCLLTANHTLFDFQKLCVPFLDNNYSDINRTIRPSQTICHIDIFRKSHFYQRVKDNFSEIITRHELEKVLYEDERRYAPLLKRYKTCIIDKSISLLCVETAKSGFSNWIDLMTVATLLKEYDIQHKPERKTQTNLEQKIISFFEDGTLNVDKPHRLYFLLLAMWVRRLLESKEIPAFVQLVKKAYPSVVNEEHSEEKIVYSLQNMNKKSNKIFDTFIKDYSSMIEYIDSMYPKKKNNSRGKYCEDAVNLANNLFLKLA